MPRQGGWPASGFAERLRQLREREGLSQAQLAERVGTHALTISKLERGLHEPLWPLALALADALGAGLDEFRGTTGAATEPRPRGRPRKAEAPPAAKPKKPRGRPRKGG